MSNFNGTERPGLLRISMQHFAEGGEPNTDPAGGTGTIEPEGNKGSEGNNPTSKIFTQEEVNAMMTKEKNQGKNAILKILGIKDETEAQGLTERLKSLKEFEDSKKTADELSKEKLSEAEKAKSEAESKATKLELKFQAVTLGVNSESIDDIIALAVPKMSDTKTFEDVIKELKTKPAYAGFFTALDDSTPGTGGLGFKKPNPPATSQFGQRLAQKTPKAPAQSSYFKH